MNTRTLHLHPSARCNLRCHHCYSSSGPEHRDHLDLTLLTGVIDDAAALGYGSVAVSGGEPLLYPQLPDLLGHARDRGLLTSVITNGTLADPTRLARLAPVVDAIAFSLDGPPDLHNSVRAAPWAYERMIRGLVAADAAGIAHGLLYTVTRSSLPYLHWAADLAAHYGCDRFQVHAIEAAGRATLDMTSELTDQSVLDAAFVAASLLAAEAPGGMAVHVDLIDRATLARRSGTGGTAPEILVVEEDGAVVPFTHGFPRAAAVADLGRERLAERFPAYVDATLPALDDLIEETRSALLASDRRVFDWYAELGAAAHRRLHRVPTEAQVEVEIAVGARRPASTSRSLVANPSTSPG